MAENPIYIMRGEILNKQKGGIAMNLKSLSADLSKNEVINLAKSAKVLEN